VLLEQRLVRADVASAAPHTDGSVARRLLDGDRLGRLGLPRNLFRLCVALVALEAEDEEQDGGGDGQRDEHEGDDEREVELAALVLGVGDDVAMVGSQRPGAENLIVIKIW
jgi:hypothetical protein